MMDYSMFGMEAPNDSTQVPSQDKKVQEELQQYVAMKKAQGFNQVEDIDLIEELLNKTIEKRDFYDQIERVNRQINDMVKQGVDSLENANIEALNQDLQNIEDQTGQNLQVNDENTQAQFQSLIENQANMSSLATQSYQQHQQLVNELQKEMSPEMAQVAGRVYRTRGEEGMQESIQSMTTDDLIREIYNTPGGARKLQSAFDDSSPRNLGNLFKKEPVRDRGARSFQESKENLFPEEQENLHNRLVADFQPIATNQYEEFIQGLRQRIERQQSILEELQQMEGNTFEELTRELREKSFLTEGQAEELINMPRQQAIEDYGGRMASIRTGLEFSDYSPHPQGMGSLFGGQRMGGEGITNRPRTPQGIPVHEAQIGNVGVGDNLRVHDREKEEELATLSSVHQNLSNLLGGREEIDPEDWQNFMASIKESSEATGIDSPQLQDIEEQNRDEQTIRINEYLDQISEKIGTLAGGIGAGGGNVPPLPSNNPEDGYIFKDTQFINNRFSTNTFEISEQTQGSTSSVGGGGGGVPPQAPVVGAGGEIPPEGTPADIGQSGNIMGAGAAGYAAGQYALGDRAGTARTSGDTGAAGKKGGILNTLGKTGVGALGFGALSAATDFATPGGRTGAESALGSIGSAGSGVGAAIGQVVGGPAGLVAGSYLGGQVGDVVGQFASPYLNYIQQQKGYESVTGENLQGRGSESGLLNFAQSTALVPSAEPNIQSEQASARLENLNVAPEQIQTLTDTLLQLGMTSEQAAESIGPLTDTIAQTNIDPTVAATLARTAQIETGTENESLGIENARFIADQIQQIARSGQLNQQEVQSMVTANSQEAGPIIGYQNAQDQGLAMSQTIGEMNPDTVQAMRDAGVPEQMMQNINNMRGDLGATYVSGLQDYSPMSEEFGEQGMMQQARDVQEITSTVPTQSDGEGGQEPTAEGYMMLENLANSGAYPTLQGIPPAQLWQMSQEENFTPQGVQKEIQNTKQDRTKREKRQSARAGGDIGGANKYRIRGEEPGRFAKFLPGDSTLVGRRGGLIGEGGEQNELIDASQRTAKTGIGNVGQIMRTDKGIDASQIKLEGGRTFADLEGNPQLMRRVQRGEVKIQRGDQKMTAQQFSERLMKQGGYSTKEGGLALGSQPSEAQKGGTQNVQVEFTGMAEDFFKVKDPDNPRGMPNQVGRAYGQQAADRGAPEHSSGLGN